MDNMKESRIYSFLAFLLLLATGLLGLSSTSFVEAATQSQRVDACKTPINVKHFTTNTSYNKFMFINTSYNAISNFYELGGSSTTSDKGVNWACHHYRDNGAFIGAGIIFILKSVTVGDKIPTYSGSSYKYRTYSFNTDVDASSGSTTTATLGGLVHQNSDEYTASNYAIHIGFCKTYNDCKPAGGTGNASVNTGAATAGAGGIVQRSGSDDIKVKRMINGTNYTQASFGLWSEPYIGFGSWPTVTINNDTLRTAVDNGTVSWTPISSGSRTGTVTLYIQRCWSGDGSSMGSSDTCEAGKVYLITKLKPKNNPWSAEFDGKISTSVSSDATAVTEGGSVIYYTDSKNPYANFTGQHRRKDTNNPPASASGSWSSSTTGNSGTPSLSGNSSWANVDTYKGTATLNNPGDSQKVCYYFSYYKYRKSNEEGTSSSLSEKQDKSSCITFKRYNYTHTFSGSVSGSASVNGTAMTMGTTNKVDFDKATVKFTGNLCRTDTIRPDSFNSNWKAFQTAASSVSESSTAWKSGTDALTKKNTTNACKNVYTDDRGTVNLSLGNNYFYSTLGYHTKITDAGAKSDWDEKQSWVNIYRYSWYDVEGKVEINSNATNRSGTFWIDANTANIQFKHYLKRNTTVGIQTQYYTTKDPNPGNKFPTVNSYTTSSINVNNAWYNQYNSPTNGREAVNVAKDTGTSYCQTLYYYSKVREDSNDRKSPTNTSACISLKRYKTTFSGDTKVYVNNNSTDNRDGDTIIVNTADKYPVKVPVTFKHTVTRSGSDPDGSPTKKSSSIATNIFDGTDTKGYRSGDAHGTARAAASTIGLNPSESDSYSDTFTVNVYPEQEIQLCQQMTYVNEVQGTESTKSTTGNKACIKIKMGKDTCFDQEFSIKDAKNYMRVQIRRKNSSGTKVVSSNIRYQGNHEIEAYAQPGDQIRFDYDACAGGELARQYAFSNTTTSYDISGRAEKVYYDGNVARIEYKEGYLFGDSLSSSPYTALTKNLGTSNATVGKGPFNEVYKTSTTSPHGDSIYSCNQFGTTGRLSDHYRIPNYINGITAEGYSTNCKSDDYGYASDLGATIRQVTTWTDTQYSGGNVVAGHNGAAASITANVKVPYNYKTNIITGGDGGYILPGNKHTETIRLNIDPRKNSPVDGEEYATVTKQSKYKLIEINIGPGNNADPDTFNDLVNDNNSNYYDTTGNSDLSNRWSGLPVCKSFNCSTIRTGEGRFNPVNNQAGGWAIPGTDYELTIPYNAEPGTKICYIAAIWPSDSHNLPNASDISVAQEAAGLDPRGTYWQVSGASCYTVSKRPSFNVLGGDTYAQGRISARTQKYPKNNAGADPRIYGSWTEYAAISGLSLKGYASGASLWGGSSIVSDSNGRSLNCAFSSYTFANEKCENSPSSLGKMKIDTTTSSNPETIANQMITRYTRTDGTGKMHVTGNNPVRVEDGGICKYDEEQGTYVPYNVAQGATFACIGDTGAKYTHVDNTGNQVAYIPGEVNYCMGKGDTFNSRTSIIHSDGTLVVGANMAYGAASQSYWGQNRTASGICWEDSYNSISEIPQSILIAKKIIIKDYVTYIDTWLIADEIITCDPVAGWNGDVPINTINTQNCNQQLTINGPVMTKNLKLYRTYGGGFTNNGNTSLLASPAEIFTMSPEVYLWSYNQAQRYSQATTTYARELAPRY